MTTILDPAADAPAITALLAPDSGYRFVDAWTTAAAELRAVEPEAGPPTIRYAVYDWCRTVVKIPDRPSFRRLRTARNRYLIDTGEQHLWSRALIGVAGLSVGASALSVCALTGATRFRIADRDTLGLTNLNRLRASVREIGLPKVELAARTVLDLDPYAEVLPFPDGYTPATAAGFLGTDTGAEPLAVALEEMDDIAAKIDLRRRARAARIPVVMATDNGDNAILDVERYDLDPEYPLFHGRAADLDSRAAAAPAGPRERVRLAQQIVGPEITPRTRYSLAEVGRSLPSWPQLGTAATVAGAVAAYAARLIVCGEPLASGRYRVDLDRALLGTHADSTLRPIELTAAEYLAVIDRRT